MAAAVALKPLSPGAGVAVFVGRVAGNVADSILGSLDENRGEWGSDEVNFIATTIGGLTAMALSLPF
jgi:uncharacterized membrane protein